jgi:hypothetical protein
MLNEQAPQNIQQDIWQVPGALGQNTPLTPETPPAGQWEAIEARMKKTRRRPFVWLFLPGIVGIGLCLAIWISGDSSLESAALKSTAIKRNPSGNKEQNIAANKVESNTLATLLTPQPKSMASEESGEENTGIGNSHKPKAIAKRLSVTITSDTNNVVKETEKELVQLANINNTNIEINTEGHRTKAQFISKKRRSKLKLYPKKITEKPESTSMLSNLKKRGYNMINDSNKGLDSFAKNETTLSKPAHYTKIENGEIEAVSQPIQPGITDNGKPAKIDSTLLNMINQKSITDSFPSVKSVEPITPQKSPLPIFFGISGVASTANLNLAAPSKGEGTLLTNVRTGYGLQTQMGYTFQHLLKAIPRLSLDLGMHGAIIRQAYSVIPSRAGKPVYVYQNLGDSLIAVPVVEPSQTQTKQVWQLGFVPSLGYELGIQGIRLQAGVGVWGIWQTGSYTKKPSYQLQPEASLTYPLSLHIELRLSARYQGATNAQWSTLQGQEQRIFYGIGFVWKR